MNLHEYKINQELIIVDLITKDDDKIKKLLSLGVIPGKKIRIIQKKPTYLVKINYSLLTFDNDLADIIRVRKL